MFDVGVAATMKSCFSEEFKKLFKFFRPELNQAAQLRHFCVQAAIYSWKLKENIKSCAKSAKLTGIYPYSAQILLQNSFVKEITPQNQKIADEKAKRKRTEQININYALLTDDFIIFKLNEFIKKGPKTFIPYN